MPHDVDVRWGVSIPLRDGARLSAILYLPASCSGPLPVILGMTPYVAQGLHEAATDFAKHGWPFLAVDVRGRGDSDGQFHPLNQPRDGYDVVEWLAQQPYCNGKVAMWGGSYLGYAQWAVAKERPAHLAAILPASSACYGVDFPLRGNVFLAYAVQWLALVWGRTAQRTLFADEAFWLRKYRTSFELGLPFEQFDAFCGNSSALFQEWIAHPHRDEYWDRHSPTAEQYAALDIPILTITGAYDADQLGALEYYRQHVRNAPAHSRARHYLVIGPWDHAGCSQPTAEFCGLKAGPASLVDMRALHRQWYAWTLREGPKPEFLQKNVAHYVLGADKWRYADALEDVTARSETLYLHASTNPVDVFNSGSLHSHPQTGRNCDQYVFDPRDVSVTEFESAPDVQSLTSQRMVHSLAGKQLIYHSAPFERDVEISGFFKLSLWLAIDQPDTDIRAVVYEVAADGTALHLTMDWVRARYRESLRTPNLIRTTEPLRYEFESFMFISILVRKRSRLRLVVGPMHSMYSERNYNSGGTVAAQSIKDACPVTVRLFHDAEHPSALHVPIGARCDE